MKRTSSFGVVLVLVAGSAFAQPTDADVQKAIARGLKQDVKTIDIANFVAWYDVIVTGPMGRITEAAADATSKMKAFTLADVTPEMRAQTINIDVYPHRPNSLSDAAPLVEAIVIQPPNGKMPATAVHPVTTQATPTSWGNAFGATVSGSRMSVTFDATAIPAGDFDVVLVTDRYTLRFKVKGKDRDALR